MNKLKSCIAAAALVLLALAPARAADVTYGKKTYIVINGGSCPNCLLLTGGVLTGDTTNQASFYMGSASYIYFTTAPGATEISSAIVVSPNFVGGFMTAAGSSAKQPPLQALGSNSDGIGFSVVAPWGGSGGGQGSFIIIASTDGFAANKKIGYLIGKSSAAADALFAMVYNPATGEMDFAPAAATGGFAELADDGTITIQSNSVKPLVLHADGLIQLTSGNSHDLDVNSDGILNLTSQTGYQLNVNSGGALALSSTLGSATTVTSGDAVTIQTGGVSTDATLQASGSVILNSANGVQLTGAGTPAAGKALCFNGTKIAVCTSVVGASGSCTCP
jgi:hypothetical protein